RPYTVAVSTLRLNSRIGFYHNFRRVVFSVNRHLDVVSSRFEEWPKIEQATESAAAPTSAASKSGRQIGGTWRWITTQVPLHAIDANVFGSRDISNDFS